MYAYTKKKLIHVEANIGSLVSSLPSSPGRVLLFKFITVTNKTSFKIKIV